MVVTAMVLLLCQTELDIKMRGNIVAYDIFRAASKINKAVLRLFLFLIFFLLNFIRWEKNWKYKKKNKKDEIRRRKRKRKKKPRRSFKTTVSLNCFTVNVTPDPFFYSRHFLLYLFFSFNFLLNKKYFVNFICTRN